MNPPSPSDAASSVPIDVSITCTSVRSARAGVTPWAMRGQTVPPLAGAHGNPNASTAFAGPDKKTLYIVGGGAVWKVAMIAQGLQGRAK